MQFSFRSGVTALSWCSYSLSFSGPAVSLCLVFVHPHSHIYQLALFPVFTSWSVLPVTAHHPLPEALWPLRSHVDPRLTHFLHPDSFSSFSRNRKTCLLWPFRLPVSYPSCLSLPDGQSWLPNLFAQQLQPIRASSLKAHRTSFLSASQN